MVRCCSASWSHYPHYESPLDNPLCLSVSHIILLSRCPKWSTSGNESPGRVSIRSPYIYILVCVFVYICIWCGGVVSGTHQEEKPLGNHLALSSWTSAQWFGEGCADFICHFHVHTGLDMWLGRLLSEAYEVLLTHWLQPMSLLCAVLQVYVYVMYYCVHTLRHVMIFLMAWFWIWDRGSFWVWQVNGYGTGVICSS